MQHTVLSVTFEGCSSPQEQRNLFFLPGLRGNKMASSFLPALVWEFWQLALHTSSGHNFFFSHLVSEDYRLIGQKLSVGVAEVANARKIDEQAQVLLAAEGGA